MAYPLAPDLMTLSAMSMSMSINVNQQFFNVARIAERSRVTELYWEKIDKRNVLDFDGRRAETDMVGCQLAMSSRGAMQQLEMSTTINSITM